MELYAVSKVTIIKIRTEAKIDIWDIYETFLNKW